MKKYLLILLFLCNALYSNTIEISKKGIVNNNVEEKEYYIEIKGNKEVELKEILKKINLKKEYLIISKKYKKEKIEEYKETLLEFYKDNGFYKTKIEEIYKEEKNTVSFKISEGLKLYISKVKYNVNRDILESIAKNTVLKIGNRFRVEDLKKTKTKINNFLLNNGYVSAVIDISVFLNEENKNIEIDIDIEEGKKKRIRNINLKGLKTIDKEYIDKYIVIKKGEYYNKKKIEESYRGLFLLNVFKDVTINIDNEVEEELDISIVFDEFNNYKYSASLGYDTDSGPKVKGKFVNNNFYGNLNKLEFKILYSEILKEVDLELRKPLKNSSIMFINNVEYLEEDTNFYTTKNINNKASLRYDESHTLYHKLSVERSIYENSNEVKSQISKIGYLYEYEGRNDFLNPTKGNYFNINLEVSAKGIYSDYDFIRGSLYYNHIYNYNDNLLITKTKYKNVYKKENDVINFPMTQNFFIGGSTGNRGLMYQSINTLGYFEQTVEMHTNIYNDLKFVSFMDYTYDIESGKQYPTYGVGLRYETLLGPLRIDIGRLSSSNSEIVTHFGFGSTF